jgi:hypothetical protein
VTPIEAVCERKATNRGNEGKLDSLRHEATIKEKLDGALDNSFPARGSKKDELE